MEGTEGKFPFGKRWYKRSRYFTLVVTGEQILRLWRVKTAEDCCICLHEI